MALAAGFDPARIHLHGNNKTEAELRYAFEFGVGHLILDSFDEIELADRLLDRPQKVLIRVTPGIKPSTHDYVQTGQLDSKFGFGLADRLAERAVERVRESGQPRAGRAPRPHRLPDLRAGALREGDRGDRRLLRRGRPRARAAQRRRRPRHRLPRHRRAALDRGLRRRQGPRGRSRSSTRFRGSWSSPVVRWSATPGSRPTGSGPSRRFRASAPMWPSTAGCPTTCGRCSTAPATRR